MADLICGVATGSDVLDAINLNTADTLTNTTDIATNVIDIGDNTTTITANTNSIISLQTPDAIAFTPQVTAPAHTEGTLFYDNASKTLAFYNDMDGVTLNIGQESYIKVTNNTGVTIGNGKAVKFVGISGGNPSIALAQADLFLDALVLGITTMEILDGEDGLVTTFGSVSGLNTDGLVPGDKIFLSSTIAGGFTQTPPDIASQIGVVLAADLTAGKVFVKVANTIVLPTIFAVLEGGSVGGDISDIYQTIDAYTSSDNLAMPVVEALGTIYVPTTGKYNMKANISLNYVNIANNKPTLTLGIYDGTAIVSEIPVVVTKDSEGYALFPSKLFDAVANVNYSLQIKCSINLVNPVFDLMSFEISSTHIR